MSFSFDAERPIYLQLEELLQMDIAGGKLAPGERLKPVRELALFYGVNPNTMQRALTDLEREGYLYTQRTAGRFVTEDEQMVQKLAHDLAFAKIEQMVVAILNLGYSREDLAKMVEEYLQGVAQ